MTDAQLIHEIAHGNNAAFTELYEMYRSEFICYIRKSYKGDEEIIVDLYQDSCVALYDNIRTGKLTTYSLTVKLKTYLFQIGHHKLLDFYRRNNVRTRYANSVEKENRANIQGNRALLDFEQAESHKENLDIIRQAVNTIKEPCSSILTLYIYEDKSNEDIAIMLGYSNVDSAKQQKSRCWRKLVTYVKSLIS